MKTSVLLRFLLMLTVLALLVGLTACGGGNEELQGYVPQEQAEEMEQELIYDEEKQPDENANQEPEREAVREPEVNESSYTPAANTSQGFAPYNDNVQELNQEPQTVNLPEDNLTEPTPDPVDEPPVAAITQVGFTIIFGDTRHQMSKADFLRLSPQAFSAYPRGEQRNFTGVPLATILRHFAIDHSQGSVVVINSRDGFATGISIAEAIDPNQAFIAFKEDGETFASRGGTWTQAPFMLVLAKDPFPNRFARYVMEIVIE